jgi:hypothetical protein
MFVLWGRAFGSALFFRLGGVKKPGRSQHPGTTHEKTYTTNLMELITSI